MPVLFLAVVTNRRFALSQSHPKAKTLIPGHLVYSTPNVASLITEGRQPVQDFSVDVISPHYTYILYIMRSVFKGWIRRGYLNLTCWHKSLSLYALFFYTFKNTAKRIVFSERKSYKATQFLASQQWESIGPCASGPHFSTLFDGAVEVGTSDSSWADTTLSAKFQKPPHMTDPTNNT